MDDRQAVKNFAACCALALVAAAGCSAGGGVSAPITQAAPTQSASTQAASTATPGGDERMTQGAHYVETVWANQTANAPGPTPPPPATPTPTPPPWCPVEPPAASQPEGKTRTAYVVEGDAWLVDEGGQPDRLTQFGDVTTVTISTDGQAIALTRKAGEFGGEVWAVDPDGARLRRLLSEDDLARLGRVDDSAQAGQARVIGYVPLLTRIPGRQVMALGIARVHSAMDGQRVGVDLWLLDVETGAVTKVLAAGEAGKLSPSPDGSLIAVESLKALNLVQADSLEVTPDILPPYVTVAGSTFHLYPQIIWASDSRSMKVAVVAGGDPYRQPGTTTHVWSVRVDGSAPRELAMFDAWYPVFRMSPDGQYAIYWRDPNSNNSREFYIASVDEGNEYLSMKGNSWLQIGDWTADSRHYLFGNNQDDDWGGRLMGDVCGGFRPSTPEEYAAFRWSREHGGMVAPTDVTWESYSVAVIGD